MANRSMFYSLKVGALMARFIPRRIGLAAITFFASLYGRCPGKLQNRIRSIHTRISPSLSDAQMKLRIREVIASYARYWWDVFWVSSPRSKKAILDIVTIENEHILNDVVTQSKVNNVGAIIVLPHMGSWEIPGAWFSIQGYPLIVVAERLSPPKLFELFTRTRTELGVTVIAHDDHPTSRLVQALLENKMACLVADRDLSKRGIEINFFGSIKKMPTGPGALALKTGATILPACTYSNKRGNIQIVFADPIMPDMYTDSDKSKNIHAITQKIASIFEDFILRDPTQWHVLYDEWERDG